MPPELAAPSDDPDATVRLDLPPAEAAAGLRALPTDRLAVARLLERGFASLDAIAGVSEPAFVDAMHGHLGPDAAIATHRAAAVGVRFLDSVIADARSNDTTAAQYADVGLTAASSGGCGCDDCSSATSPAAYFVDPGRQRDAHLHAGRTGRRRQPDPGQRVRPPGQRPGLHP